MVIDMLGETRLVTKCHQTVKYGYIVYRPVVREQTIGQNEPSLLIALQIISPFIEPSLEVGIRLLEAIHITHGLIQSTKSTLK